MSIRPDPWHTAERLPTGDAGAIEDAIHYLEDDPWEFRSGYAKARLLRRLTHIELDSQQAGRLRRVLLAYVDVGPRWDFREAASLARRIASTEFRDELVDATSRR